MWLVMLEEIRYGSFPGTHKQLPQHAVSTVGTWEYTYQHWNKAVQGLAI